MEQNALATFMEKYGEPDIELGQLRLWIHGKQFPDATDDWDATWVECTAHYEVPGSSVWVSGPNLRLSEIQDWAIKCHAAFDAFSPVSGDIELWSMEPNIKIKFKVSLAGTIRVEVVLYSDQTHNCHYLFFELDRTYMPKFIIQCENVLKRFPLKGKS